MNMLHGEAATPSRSTALRGSAECARASASIASYVGQASRIDDHRALRAHLNACSDCNELYRAALLAAARHGREVRRERQIELQREQSESAERRAPPVAAPRRKRLGLKAFVGAAIAVALLARAFPAHSGPAVELLAGHARLGDRELTAGGEATPLRAGDWLTTEDESRARIAGAGVDFDLGPSSRVRIVEPDRSELRLDAGELTVDGACTVTTQWGWVQVESGRARFECEEEDVLVESATASALAATGFGEHRLAAGGSVRLASVGR